MVHGPLLAQVPPLNLPPPPTQSFYVVLIGITDPSQFKLVREAVSTIPGVERLTLRRAQRGFLEMMGLYFGQWDELESQVEAKLGSAFRIEKKKRSGQEPEINIYPPPS